MTLRSDSRSYSDDTIFDDTGESFSESGSEYKGPGRSNDGNKGYDECYYEADCEDNEDYCEVDGENDKEEMEVERGRTRTRPSISGSRIRNSSRRKIQITTHVRHN